jgi:GNAT superfamily N-acetyltransferase
MGGLAPPRPLAAEDNRASFDCGRDVLNRWFLRYAWHNQLSGVTRTSVIDGGANGEIAGYVSLSTAQIERAWLAKSAQRNQPDPVPAVLLGQLAVDLNYQKRGLARSLLLHALETALRVSESVGCFAVITLPLDEAVRAFYRQFDFADLPFDPGRSMVIRMSDIRINKTSA